MFLKISSLAFFFLRFETLRSFITSGLGALSLAFLFFASEISRDDYEWCTVSPVVFAPSSVDAFEITTLFEPMSVESRGALAPPGYKRGELV